MEGKCIFSFGSKDLHVINCMFTITRERERERERESIVLQEENQGSIKFSRAKGKLKIFIM